MKTITFIFFIISIQAYGQDNNLLVSGLIFEDFDDPKIINEELFFEGFIVFEIPKKTDRTIYLIEESSVNLNVYCVKELEDIPYLSKRYYLINDIFLFSMNEMRKKKLPKNIQSFFRERFEKVYLDSSKCGDNGLSLNTKIFSRINFYNFIDNTDIGYFIFKVSLKAAIIKSDLYYPIFEYVNGESVKTKKLGSITQAKILLTLGKCIEISEIISEELIKYGFIKSDWYPDFL
ncbi:MAG: hypothetical protein KDK36_06495 [Leptospiraceae bacterium]|nr:hypothetical protein [Leptospiraceae bacterium]